MTKPGKCGKDLVSSLGPNERFRLMVSDLKIMIDGSFQFSGASVDAASKLLLGEGSEPPLYEVKP